MALKFGMVIMSEFPPEVTPVNRLPEMREQVRAAAETGMASIWVLQHYVCTMPTFQPVPLLAALASDAGSMTLGSNMFILPLRHPVDVAEDFSTLDHLTGGRAVAGFGMGYRENEFEAFGVPLADRLGRYEESIAVIKGLWSGEPLSFSGKHFRIDNQQISLPPVQAGGPPIWIGAGPHRTGARRAARLGDAWMIPPHVSPEKLAYLLRHYRAELATLGRATADVVVRRELVLHRDREQARKVGIDAHRALDRRYAEYNSPQQGANYRHIRNDKAAEEVADASYLFTDPEGAIGALKALEEQGVTYVILRMQWYDLGQNHVLDTLESFKHDVLPHFR
jgi:alkanesulfonate monooxygenase SsuD/methylene tetrahydromethanopterin reductase-like flavin-dependent oxidoreductase (luciferase family)